MLINSIASTRKFVRVDVRRDSSYGESTEDSKANTHTRLSTKATGGLASIKVT